MAKKRQQPKSQPTPKAVLLKHAKKLGISSQDAEDLWGMFHGSMIAQARKINKTVIMASVLLFVDNDEGLLTPAVLDCSWMVDE